MLASAYITTYGANPLEAVEEVKRSGFDAIGLRLAGPVGHPLNHPIISDASMIHALKVRTAELDLAILDIELITLTPEFVPDSALPLLDTAAELNAQFVQVVGEDANEARACENLKTVCDEAANRRLSVALEFMAFRSLDTLARANAWLEQIDAPNAAILVDALHLARSGGTPSDVAALPLNRVAFVQLCDAPGQAPKDIVYEARNARLYPGDGSLPLRQLLAVANQVPISIEVPCLRTAHLSPAQQCELAFRKLNMFLTNQDET